MQTSLLHFTSFGAYSNNVYLICMYVVFVLVLIYFKFDLLFHAYLSGVLVPLFLFLFFCGELTTLVGKCSIAYLYISVDL
jgi:hypothetical protein